MKTAVLLFVSITVLLFSCKKADNSDAAKATPTPVDTREFVSFRLKSDSIDDELIVLDSGDLKNTSGNFISGPVSFRLDVKKQGRNLTAFFKINRRNTGNFSFDTITIGGILLPGYKGNPAMFTHKGSVSITYFPIANLDYITGAFSGTFLDIYDSSKLYTITEGQYRIQRKD